jgi:hypothetical protein
VIQLPSSADARTDAPAVSGSTLRLVVANAVNGVHRLGDGPVWVGSVRDVARPHSDGSITDGRPSTSSIGDTKADGGRSSHAIDIKLGSGSRDTGLRVLATVRDRALQIEFRANAASGKTIADYRFLAGDGAPLPGWLNRVGSGLLLGDLPVDIEVLDLRVHVLYADGTSDTIQVNVDPQTGIVRPLGTGKRSDALPFIEQFRARPSLSAETLQGLDRAARP